jgi:hypothetical protein
LCVSDLFPLQTPDNTSNTVVLCADKKHTENGKVSREKRTAKRYSRICYG